MSRTSDNKIPDVKRTWSPILAITTWLVATFCSGLTFSIKLSSISDIDETVIVGANILVALVVGLIVLAANNACRRKGKTFWMRMSLLSVTAFFLAFIIFSALRSTWTCQYTDEIRLVIGSTPSVDLSNYLSTFEKPESPSCSELLADYGGATDRMYSIPELTGRFLMLVFVYFIMWCSLSSAVISIAYGLAAKSPKPE